MVTVTVTLTTTVSLLDRARRIFASIGNLLVSNAYAALNPTISALATAKIVNGAVTLVNPVFTTTVADPANPNLTKVVSVTCDTSSIPITVNVSHAWQLNVATGDILVDMSVPTSVTAIYDSKTNTFSSCSFNYSSAYYIIFSDQLTQLLDLSALPSATAGCNPNVDSGLLHVEAANDPSRNTSTTPLINYLFDASSAGSGGFTLGPLCGSIEALSYSERASPTLTKLNFSNTIAPGDWELVADPAHVYAVGTSAISRSYGGSAPSATCPISVTQVGASGSTCITIPNIATYINYPVTPGTPAPVSFANMFIDGSGTPTLSLQSIASCANGACNGIESAPNLFSINSTAASSSLVLSNPNGYPWGSSAGMEPVGSSNGYVQMAIGGPVAMLWNPISGASLAPCGSVNLQALQAGCSQSLVDGNYLYGISYCASSSNNATPGNTCLNSPIIARVDTSAGLMQNWDPVANGWLPIASVQITPTFGHIAVSLFYPDHVEFLACPAPNLDCSAPEWVSLDYASGKFTPEPLLNTNIVNLLVNTSLN